MPQTLTLLHGFTQSGRSWDELASLLPGYEILAPDLRGHGSNPAPAAAPHTMEGCEADLLQLWAERGVERTHLAGYSMGGRLALFLAVRHPERLLSLTTISAHAGIEGAAREERRRRDEELAARIEREGIEWFASHWSALPLFAGLARRGPEYVESVRRARLRNRADGLAASLRGMGQGVAPALWDRLGGLSVPSLFLAGARDPGYAEAVARMAALVPGARAEVLAEAGHSLHLEEPETAAALLSSHLSTL